jgi:hypothetical protein
MWFWINFSPIGQAPPAPKKSSDSSSEKDPDVEPEAKIDRSYFSHSFNDLYEKHVSFLEGKKLGEFVGEVSVREGVNHF